MARISAARWYLYPFDDERSVKLLLNKVRVYDILQISYRRRLRNHGWETDGMTYFCWNCMFYVIMLFCFIILVKIAVSKRPFSGALVTLFYGVGLLFITGSAIFPSLPGYTQPHMLSGVEGGFYIDMIPFMAGLVLVLFGRILRYGFEYQKEMDSIL